jgi:hypothetical protein
MPSFDKIGSEPIIKVRFGSMFFGKCTLFWRAIPTDNAIPFSSFNNTNTSSFTFGIDPEKRLGSGKVVSDLQDCEVSWVVTFVNLSGSISTASFSFDLTIEQDTNVLTGFSKTGTIPATNKTISGAFTFTI